MQKPRAKYQREWHRSRLADPTKREANEARIARAAARRTELRADPAYREAANARQRKWRAVQIQNDPGFRRRTLDQRKQHYRELPAQAQAVLRETAKRGARLRWSTPEGRAVQLLHRSSLRAARKGISHTLSRGWIQTRLEHGACEVSGLAFDMRAGDGRKPRSPSIDRLDSALGYTQDNCRLVLWAVNAACGEWGLEAASDIWHVILQNQAGTQKPS